MGLNYRFLDYEEHNQKALNDQFVRPYLTWVHHTNLKTKH